MPSLPVEARIEIEQAGCKGKYGRIERIARIPLARWAGLQNGRGFGLPSPGHRRRLSLECGKRKIAVAPAGSDSEDRDDGGEPSQGAAGAIMAQWKYERDCSHGRPLRCIARPVRY